MLIGISGKPGSGKNGFSFKIIQELRYQDYSVEKVSLAKGIYEETNKLIEAVALGTDLVGFDLSAQQADHLTALLQNDLGPKHPEWGYNRRNEFYRKAMSFLALTRRDQDENYWLRQMEKSISKVDFAVFTELRFPNEANYVNQNGITIRADIHPDWVNATKTDQDGWKYSAEGMNDPTETALDDYPDFYAHVRIDYFNGKSFTRNMLRYLDLKVVNTKF